MIFERHVQSEIFVAKGSVAFVLLNYKSRPKREPRTVNGQKSGNVPIHQCSDQVVERPDLEFPRQCVKVLEKQGREEANDETVLAS